jgi:hypothetical protein
MAIRNATSKAANRPAAGRSQRTTKARGGTRPAAIEGSGRRDRDGVAASRPAQSGARQARAQREAAEAQKAAAARQAAAEEARLDKSYRQAIKQTFFLEPTKEVFAWLEANFGTGEGLSPERARHALEVLNRNDDALPFDSVRDVVMQLKQMLRSIGDGR